MKNTITALVTMLALSGAATLVAQQAPPPPPPTQKPADAKVDPKAASSHAGKWVMALESPQGAMSLNLDVKIDTADKVTGTLESPNGPTPIGGEFKDSKLGFTISFDAGGQMIEIYFEGAVKDDGTMAGTMHLGEMGSFPWSATRPKGL